MEKVWSFQEVLRLHTLSYKNVLEGKGFGIEEVGMQLKLYQE